MLTYPTRKILLIALLLGAVPAQAELPEGVQAMIDAAIATGDKAKVTTVIEIARQTNPDDAEQIDKQYHVFLAQDATKKQEAAKTKEAEIRNAGLLDDWTGNAQIGASHSTGKSETVGASVALKLKRDGIDWSHRVRAAADFQRTAGRTNREQFLLAYEPRYQISKPLFTYGLAQFERDRIQGFSARYILSGGLGYKVLDQDGLHLSTKAGPALRRTEFTTGANEDRLAGLFGFDFDWRILDGLTLTQSTDLTAETGSSATVVVDSANTTINLLTGLEAKVSDRLSTRFSYQIDYDSNPPAGAVSTDTISRFSLVYGF